MFTTHIVWDNATNKMKENKNIKFIVGHFSLTFVNLSLGWMFHFCEWLQNKGKLLS